MRKNLFRSIMVLSVAALALSCIAPARAEDEGKAEKKKEKRYQGTIESMDAAAMTVTVKKKVKSETFKCTEDCKFATLDNKNAAMSDLKVGDDVNVIYSEADGTKMARRVAQRKKPLKDDNK